MVKEVATKIKATLNQAHIYQQLPLLLRILMNCVAKVPGLFYFAPLKSDLNSVLLSNK